jgi:hypothetical protein
MQKHDAQDSPFRFIKVRSLVAWSILGLVPALVLAVLTSADNPLVKVATLAGTVVPFLWVRCKFRRHRIQMSDFMGDMPQRKPWLSWLATVAALIGLSIGCGYLIWYPLSYVAPSLFDELILSQSTFVSDSGIPKPIGMVLLEIILVVTLIPVVEELCFRGIILHRWTLKWGMRKSIILSSLLFGLLHADVIGKVMFGFVMAVLYIRTRSLWVPIFCHALNNTAAYVMEGITYAATGPVKPTIDGFRSHAWIGWVCLCLTIPWAMFYVVRNWPMADWRMPYSPEPGETDNIRQL